MPKIVLLLRAQLYNTFAFNELFASKSKNKNYTFLMGISLLIIVVFISAYNVLTALTLANLEQQVLIPAYMVAISSFIILGLTLLWSNGMLFGTKDFEMLSALPVSSRAIVFSKFAFMYLLSFVLCFLFMIPGGIVWVCTTPDSTIFFLIYLIGAFFVPLIPMCTALLLGILITVVSSRLQHKNIFSLIFSLVALGSLLVIGIYSMESGISGGNIGVILAKQISRLYPLSTLFMYQNPFAILQNITFDLLSAIVFLITLQVASLHYLKLNTLMLQNTANTPTKTPQKKHSQLVALYQKELRRFFSSYLYMLNTGLGIFALCTLCLLLCIVPPSILVQYTGIEDPSTFFGQFAPLIIVAMLSLSCTTASSISLEGENIWILKSIPLSKKAFLNAKILLNLSLHAVAYLLSLIVFTLRFELDPLQTITLIIVPIVYSIFTAVQGLYFNAKFPNLDWDNEVVVIKQSLSVILSGGVGMLAVAIPTLLYWFLGFSLQSVLWSTACILIFITTILYQKTCGRKII